MSALLIGYARTNRERPDSARHSPRAGPATRSWSPSSTAWPAPCLTPGRSPTSSSPGRSASAWEGRSTTPQTPSVACCSMSWRWWRSSLLSGHAGTVPAGAECCGLMTWTPAREAGVRVVKQREDGVVRRVMLVDDGGDEVVPVNRFLVPPVRRGIQPEHGVRLRLRPAAPGAVPGRAVAGLERLRSADCVGVPRLPAPGAVASAGAAAPTGPATRSGSSSTAPATHPAGTG